LKLHLFFWQVVSFQFQNYYTRPCTQGVRLNVSICYSLTISGVSSPCSLTDNADALSWVKRNIKDSKASQSRFLYWFLLLCCCHELCLYNQYVSQMLFYSSLQMHVLWFLIMFFAPFLWWVLTFNFFCLFFCNFFVAWILMVILIFCYYQRLVCSSHTHTHTIWTLILFFLFLDVVELELDILEVTNSMQLILLGLSF
jgi:hypothetical protein